MKETEEGFPHWVGSADDQVVREKIGLLRKRIELVVV